MDSRFAAAIGELVRRWCQDRQINAVSTLLLFGCGQARGHQRRIPKGPNEQIYPQLFAPRPTNWMKWQIRAGWLLEAILTANGSLFHGLPMEQRINRYSMGCFMIGYNLDDVAPEQANPLHISQTAHNADLDNNEEEVDANDPPMAPPVEDPEGLSPNDRSDPTLVSCGESPIFPSREPTIRGVVVAKVNRVPSAIARLEDLLSAIAKLGDTTEPAVRKMLGSVPFEYGASTADVTVRFLLRHGFCGLPAAVLTGMAPGDIPISPAVLKTRQAYLNASFGPGGVLTRELVCVYLRGYTSAMNMNEAREYLIKQGFAGNANAAKNLRSVGTAVGKLFGLLSDDGTPTDYFHQFFR